MTDLAALHDLIEPIASTQGLALVRVAMIGGTSDPTLQVMAERPDTRQLTIDDCADLSRGISEVLDALEADGRDPIAGAYRLEVSSPGIDRPLTRIKDFEDWAGQEARVNLVEALDGRKQFAGTLDGVEPKGEVVQLIGKDGIHYFLPFDMIQSAKLLLTDRLINATAPLSTEGADTIKTEG